MSLVDEMAMAIAEAAGNRKRPEWHMQDAAAGAKVIAKRLRDILTQYEGRGEMFEDVALLAEELDPPGGGT